MFEHARIRIMLCCNDPRNGIFAHRLSGLEIGPNMSFMATAWYESREPRMRWIEKDGVTHAIAIAGKHFPIVGYRSWVGNWCWDMAVMEGRTVLELLNWPRLRRFFDITEGETRLFNWWKAGQPWKDDDLRLISKTFCD